MTPLVQYQITIQFLEEPQGTAIDDFRNRNLVTHSELFYDYKKAKKAAQQVLKNLKNKDVVTAKIEPVLLSENLLG